MPTQGPLAQHAAPTAGGAPAEPVLDFARRVIREESRALATLADRLDDRFADAVRILTRCADQGGTVLVTGVGKSGWIGQKISATLASLGIPSHFVHPTEAAHGDLGRFRAVDAVLCISYSGETVEVVALAGVLRQDGLPIIAVTGGAVAGGAGESPGVAAPQSSLERLATVALRLHVSEEAGAPRFVAPTSSTTATLALGDALALSAALVRNFTSDDFARRHPGGALGSLLRPVVEVMRWTAGKNLPLVSDALSVRDALDAASKAQRRPGALMLVDDRTRALSGIFTDSDLRRLVLRDPGALDRPVRDVMTRAPRTLRDDAVVSDAVALFLAHRQDEIPVVDTDGKPAGLLDVQDLIALRLVRE